MDRKYSIEPVHLDPKKLYKDNGNFTWDTFENRNGLKICCYHWPPKGSYCLVNKEDSYSSNGPSVNIGEEMQKSQVLERGKILFIHGYGNHSLFEFLRHSTNTDSHDSLVYDQSWIHSMNSIGYSVYCMDLQSHGFSEGWEGKCCQVECCDDFAYDVIEFLLRLQGGDIFKTKSENFCDNKSLNPFILSGISMGGWVTLRTIQLINKSLIEPNCQLPTMIQNYRNEINGIILFSPMLSLEGVKNENKYLRPFGEIISKLLPHFGVGKKVTNKDYDYINRWEKNDLLVYKGKARARLSMQLLKAVDVANADMKYIKRKKEYEERFSVGGTNDNLKILVIHSKNDTLCETDGSINFINSIGGKILPLNRVDSKEFSPLIDDASLWLLDDHWHSLTMEEGWDKLKNKVISDFILPITINYNSH